MILDLHNPAPRFLKEKDLAASEVWRKQQVWKQGQKIRICAPSGRGKTTLIHVLYGLQINYEGDVYLNQMNLRLLKDRERALVRQQCITIVFQDLRLFPQLTGWENIEINAVLTGNMDMERVEQQAGCLGVGHALEKKCGQLSQGEQQRIAILRALAQPFEWILLDEPFSHLDTAAAETAAALLLDDCREKGAGFVCTSLGDERFLPFDKECSL
ncbi:MAG: ATP-binding cassette domain-containing protein [Planctomycetota bacterium]